MILIRDPELIKTVLVKDFNSFCDNGFELSEKIDPLLGYNPFGVKGLQEYCFVFFVCLSRIYSVWNHVFYSSIFDALDGNK